MESPIYDLYPRFCGSIDLSLIQPDRPVLCAISGGPDSCALTDLLQRLSGEFPFHLIAAHFNHHLRGDQSNDDKAFVREFCASRSIELHVGSAENLLEDAKTSGQSIEMAARDARLKFLFSKAKELGCDIIALGNTADDRIENLLLRLLRGSGGTGHRVASRNSKNRKFNPPQAYSRISSYGNSFLS